MKTLFTLFISLFYLSSQVIYADSHENAEVFKPKSIRLSIITSVFKGEEFIEGFLDDIVNLSNFDECELILINANSPQNEEKFIKPYLEKYPNIVYEKLAADPGVYGVWNLAIKKARGEYLTNANLDDRRNREFPTKQIQFLDEHSDVDLVYSDYILTQKPNETFGQNTAAFKVTAPEFSPEILYLCLAGPQPMWRKSMHDRCGLFCEDFKTSGDLEMWNRAVSQGCKLKRIEGWSGLYYENPQGLSTHVNSKKDIENEWIASAYGYMWRGINPNNPPKILLKIQSQNDLETLFNSLRLYYRNLSGFICYHVLVSLDASDPKMNNQAIIEKLRAFPNLSYHYGKVETNIQFINHEFSKNNEFDVTLICNPAIQTIDPGFELVVINKMQDHFPKFDGILFFDTKEGQPTLDNPVIGKNCSKEQWYLFETSLSKENALEKIKAEMDKQQKLKIIPHVLFNP